MMDIRVVVGASGPSGLMALYQKQVEGAGMPFHVMSPGEIPNNGVGHLGMKIRFFREVLERHGGASHLVLTDAWDVLFYGTAEEVVGKIPQEGVLQAAERNCWPDEYLAKHFPGETPWRFANGGGVAGTPEQLSKWCDRVEGHAAYLPLMLDQQWMNHRVLGGDLEGWELDTRTRLFYCMVKEAGEMQLDEGVRPVNALTGSRPQFIHFNGKTDASLFQVLVQLKAYGQRVIGEGRNG